MLYPLVDVTNWLRLAAMRKDRSADTEPARREALRGVFGIYALESGLLWLFFGGLCALGALAVAAPGGIDTLEAFVGGLMAADNGVTALALSKKCAIVAAGLRCHGGAIDHGRAVLRESLHPSLRRAAGTVAEARAGRNDGFD